MTTLGGQRPILRAVLGEASGSASARIERALGLLLEELGMEVAFVGELTDGDRVVTYAAHAPGAAPVPVGMSHPLEDTLCHRFIDGESGPIVADVRGDAEIADHPHAVSFDIGAYAGVPLSVDGVVVGALCCASSSPVAVIEERHITTLQTVAEYVSALLQPTPAQQGVTSVSAENELELVAGALADGGSLESLSRPLLEMLQAATGLDSTFLTAIDWAAGQQRVLYAVNTAEIEIPEGITVDWSDALCRRSLSEGRTYTSDVQATWPDATAAVDLGITTYVSVPVVDQSSNVIGTLCGTSSRAVDVDPRHIATMRMFAVLIGQQIAAQATATAEQQRAAELESRLTEVDDLALRDPLTGLLNRRGIERWLDVASANLRPGEEQLVVSFCDLDGFKQVNDTLGHAAGDEALRAFAAALRTIGRGGDLHGRLGGDEFIVAAVLPAGAPALGIWSGRVRHVARATVPGRAGPREIVASVGIAAFDAPTTPGEALSAADAAMYADKASRRASR